MCFLLKMFKEMCSSLWCIVVIILLAEIVLSAPQGYDYYANQQRIYNAQRAAQVQRIQAQRIAAQNRYYQQSLKTTTTRKPVNKINRADSENAKFLGSHNQEFDESGKTLKKKGKQLFGGGYGPGYGAGVGNGCRFRKTDEKKGEGRVFWDFNVYNVYPDGGCGNGGIGGIGGVGGGGGGAALGDPYPGNFGAGYPSGYGGGWADPYYGYGYRRPIRGFFQNWLGLLLPGGALSGVNRPPLQGGNSQADSTNAGSSSSVPAAPNFQFLSDSDVMMGVSPNQLVSGVASTVNNVLQQLSYPYYG